MDASFAGTGALMAGAFIVVLFTKLGNPSDPVLSLELAVTFIATISYVLFWSVFKGKTRYQPSDIPKLRYVEWTITTPLMLIALCLLLGGGKASTTLLTKVVALDWLMLGIGYFGEIGYLDRTTACFLGFAPFVALFYLIYKAFPSFNLLFAAYFVVWSMYGFTYMLENRTVVTNLLDAVAKSGFAIAYCIQ